MTEKKTGKVREIPIAPELSQNLLSFYRKLGVKYSPDFKPTVRHII
jgi:hypothetical protein